MQPGQVPSNVAINAQASGRQRAVSVESGANILAHGSGDSRLATAGAAPGSAGTASASGASGTPRVRLLGLVGVMVVIGVGVGIVVGVGVGPLHLLSSADEPHPDPYRLTPASAAHNKPDIPSQPLRPLPRTATQAGLAPIESNGDGTAREPRPDPLRPIALPNTAETARTPEVRFHSASGPARALSVRAVGYGERRFNASGDNEIRIGERTFRITSVTVRQVTLFEPAKNQTFRIPVE